MSDFFLPREKTFGRLDALCQSLFDTWCEQRNQVPLAYLLHCWPLVDDDGTTLRRLAAAMSDLARYHRDAIGSQACVTVRQLIDSAHALSAIPAPAANAAVKGSGILPRAST
ncbi:MAG TPA: hypothetical protein VFE79_02735 [Paraburkholderia sp.]|jgi:hypothetical protein|nr:hypothetical protein [Paraburkholderia sp.]